MAHKTFAADLRDEMNSVGDSDLRVWLD